jgi:glycosyltransferase involved in cell wall biosynthesis
MKNIFFSIVIPNYNSQDTIEACIKSCLEQSFHDFEIIIVDDYSSDLSPQIIEQIIDENAQINIIYEKFKYNQGASAARNRGIELAKGEYIALLDSDDYFHKNKLKIINDILSKNKNIDLLGHSYVLGKNVHLDVADNYPEPMKIPCSRLILKNFAVTPSLVFKKSLNIRFDETMRYAEDHDFLIRTCFSGYNIYYVDIPLVTLGRVELSAGGQSANNWKMRIGEIKMYMKLYKIHILFLFVIPFLVIFSTAKHLYKLFKALKK